MNGRYSGLAARIRQALLDLEQVATRAEQLLGKALHSGDDGYYDGVALNLHGFYASVERIFEDIARSVEGSLPGGPEWHRELLLQMASAISDTRPPVIGTDTRRCLEEYRAFRHVVRNVYTFNLRPSRLRELTEELPACRGALEQELGQFVAFLESAAQSE